MLADFVLRINGLKDRQHSFKLTLKLDQLYVDRWEAMGIWAVENFAKHLDLGVSSENSSNARWFWDTYNNEIKLKIGWFEGYSDDDARIVFTLINYKNKFRIGDWGRGDYHTPDKQPITIDWAVEKILAASPRQYPAK